MSSMVLNILTQYYLALNHAPRCSYCVEYIGPVSPAPFCDMPGVSFFWGASFWYVYMNRMTWIVRPAVVFCMVLNILT